MSHWGMVSGMGRMFLSRLRTEGSQCLFILREVELSWIFARWMMLGNGIDGFHVAR